MIRVKKNVHPPQLTLAEQRRLTDLFRKDRENVWRATYITDSLLESTFSKCAYCECKLNEESNYLHVEHFLPKDIYPWYVVEWNNLLPSCQKCNVRKGKYDPIAFGMIVNPAIDNPKDHFKIKNFRIEEKYKVDKGTSKLLGLNDRKAMQEVRFRITSKTLELLDDICTLAAKCLARNAHDDSERETILSKYKGLLFEAQPDSEYAATVATALFDSEKFVNLTDLLLRLGIWDNEVCKLFWLADEISLC